MTTKRPKPTGRPTARSAHPAPKPPSPLGTSAAADPWIILRTAHKDWPLDLPVEKGLEPGSALDQALYPLVRQWTYRFADREQATSSGLATLGARARADLAPFGLDEAAWSDLAASEFIEVSIRYVNEKANYAALLLPWEQLLSAATRSRRNRRIHIARHLRCGREAQLPPAEPASLLTVACAPGRLAKTYAQEFAGECRFMDSILAPTIATRAHLEDPSRGVLKEALAAQAPGVVHLACVDLLMGLPLFPELGGIEREEGVLLADPRAEVEPVSAMAFGKLLELDPSSRRPVLVAFSTCYSAYRSAALAVAHGARLAIGFSGSVDRALAEQFFSTFYREWTDRDWDALAAFEVGRVASLESPLGRSGQAIVLWSASSLVKGRKRASTARAAAARRRAPTPSPAPTAVAPAPTPAPTSAAAEVAPAPSVVEADVEALTELNFSLLHNRGGLFRKFRLRNPSGQPSHVQVQVELYTGEERFPWRDSFDLGGFGSCDLATKIEVPLLAERLRRARESLRTSLFVEVKAGAETLVQRTFPIELLSADEWRDEKESWRLLPAFVLPRDPAVLRLLSAAEPYLKAIADDFNAGFDGYQQAVGPDFITVDQQVRAVWSALQHEMPLTYINPPPTYTAASQRVRAPSRILAERRGTCIDLALLFAACLEQIGIKPVLFLLRGHAFAGYWRDPEGHVDWTEKNPTSAVVQAPQLPDCLEYVQAGALVPLETTRVTARGSFAEACEQGVGNLADPDLFDAMIDVHMARSQQVLPLPLEPEAFEIPRP
jgi:hypothetical protein